MNWSDPVEVLATIGLAILFGVLFLRAPLLVMFTPRASDFVSIKAKYEGFTSPTGPYSTVKSIERTGFYVSRTQAARRYTVVIELAGGRTISRRVYVDAGLFRDGEVGE